MTDAAEPQNPDAEQEVPEATDAADHKARSGLGRKVGSRNRVSASVRDRIAEEADPIGLLGEIANGDTLFPVTVKNRETGIETTFDQTPTLDQRMTAAKILTDKLIANAKSREIPITIPRIRTVEDAAAAYDVVWAALAEGKIRLDEAQAVSAMIDGRVAIMVQLQALEDMDVVKKALLASGHLRLNSAGKLEANAPGGAA